MNRKRLCFLILIAMLLSILGGCGQNNDSSLNSLIDMSVEPTNFDSSWTRKEIDYSGSTFVQKQIDVPASIAPSGLKISDDGFCYVTNNLKKNQAVFGMTDGELNIIDEYTLGIASEESSISFFDFGKDVAYFCRCNYELNPDDNETFVQKHLLCQYTTDGVENWSVMIDENFGKKEPNDQLFVTGIATLPDDGVLITTQNYIYWLEAVGDIVATVPTDGIYYSPIRSKDGTIYLVSSTSDVSIHPINHERHTIEASILSCDGNTTVYDGSGEYDFLLNTNSSLMGVSLETHSIQTLLEWSKCGLTVIPSTVFCMGSECWWVVGYSVMSDESQLIELRCVPADRSTEKKTVTMAVPVDSNLTVEDSLGYEEFATISEFNATNDTYVLEYYAYKASEDLLIKFLGGDVPDILMFSSVVHQADVPSEQLFARKGYFLDLEDFISADPELSLDSFLPAVINTQKNTLGGLYTLPTGLNFRMLYGQKEYVGSEPSWDLHEFESVLSSIDSDTRVVPFYSGLEFLKSMLEVNLSNFINFQTMTCDFESSDFSTLLRSCKENMELESNQDDVSVKDGSALMDYISTLSGVGGMAERIQSISSYATVKGFPGVSGSGGAFTFGKTYAICNGCAEPDGAWAYLKKLLSPAYQENCLDPFIPVMQASFDQLIETWLDKHAETCTVEMIERVTQLIENTTTRCCLDSPAMDIVIDEATAYFNDMQTLEITCKAIQNRVQIFLSEQQ